MKHIFWNVHNNIAVNNMICSLIIENQCDVISLAEYVDQSDELLMLLANHGLNFYTYPNIGCDRITLLSRFNINQIQPLTDNDYYTFKRFPHKQLGFITIGFVHFPSQLQIEDIDYIELAHELREDIEEIEEKLDDKKTLIVGDFNINPFENAMTSAMGLHAIPWAKQAQKIKRVVRNHTYYFFYNPMWNLLGDYVPPTGSYYYQKAISNCIFWNIFDQVILRPSLINSLDVSKIQLIMKINDIVLTNPSGIPNVRISDHLPLYFEL